MFFDSIYINYLIFYFIVIYIIRTKTLQYVKLFCNNLEIDIL